MQACFASGQDLNSFKFPDGVPAPTAKSSSIGLEGMYFVFVVRFGGEQVRTVWYYSRLLKLDKAEYIHRHECAGWSWMLLLGSENCSIHSNGKSTEHDGGVVERHKFEHILNCNASNKFLGEWYVFNTPYDVPGNISPLLT